jgi:hypothetical protein
MAKSSIDFISDEEMAELDNKDKAPEFISDKDMAEFISDEEMTEIDKPVTDSKRETLGPKIAEPKKIDRLKQLEAGLKGAGQGATLGFLDEAIGAVNAGIDMAIDKAMRPFLSEAQTLYLETPEFTKIYKEERDKARKDLEKQAKSYPKTFTGGEIAGALATAAVPGSLAAKASSNILKKLAVAAGTGAGAGAGFSEAEKAEDIAKDAAQGALVGAAFLGAGKAAGKLLGKIGKLSDNAQLKALGITGKKLEKISPEGQKELTKFSRKLNILTPNAEKTLENATKVKEAAVSKLIDFHTSLKAQGIKFLDKKQLVKDLKEQVLKKYDHKDTASSSKLVKSIIGEVNKLPDDLSSARDLYSRIGAHVRNQTGFDKEAARYMYKIMSNNIDDSLTAAGNKIKNPALKDTYRQVTKEYKLANSLAEAAERQFYKIPEKINPLSMIGKRAVTTALVGTAGATGGPLALGAAVGAVAAKKLASKYGPSMISKTQSIIEKGGPTAERLVDLIKRGNLDKVSTILLTEKLSEK